MKAYNYTRDSFEGDRNPFRVPSGYFEESRRQIMEKIAGMENETHVRKINLRRRLIWVSGIAASLLIGIVLIQNFNKKTDFALQMAQEIEWFINYSGPDLNVGTLASYIVDEGISYKDMNVDLIDEERSSLLELTDYDELFIIEEWMKSENQKK